MNPLERNREILERAIVRGRVAISPALTREAQLGNWLASLESYCERHKRTRLVLDRAASRKRTLSQSDGTIWFDWHNPFDPAAREAPKDLHFFEAVFRCPACKVEYAQVPREFFESSFVGYVTKTPEQIANLAKSQEYAAQIDTHQCGFLVMSGFPGNGKTRLASNIVREVESEDALYLTQGQIALLHRQTYAHRYHHMIRPRDEYLDEHPEGILEVAKEVFLLVLDEIGAKALSADEMLLIDELFKHRYNERKPTILVSNLPVSCQADRPGLKEFLGDALSDRIVHATGNGKFLLQFSGESYRRTVGDDYLSGLRSDSNL